MSASSTLAPACIALALAASCGRGDPAAIDAGAASARPASPPRPGRFVDAFDATTFQKGNLHTHTLRSDGDSEPEDVYAWYRLHGYAFVAITDHNGVTIPAAGTERPGFTVLLGEEITMLVRGQPVHVNGICIQKKIDGGDFPDNGAALRWAVSAVAAQGGVSLVNHPNFEWALGERDLPEARGARLLEIWSGHPHVRPAGDASHPSAEAIWQAALDRGMDFAPAAVDDTHHLQSQAPEPAARPGRAWVQVVAPEATTPAICAGLGAGKLYASNGAESARLAVEGDTLTIKPAAPAQVELIGAGGATLADVRTTPEAPEAKYKLRGGEPFVRARVTLPDGKRAWTSAFRVRPAE